MKKRLVSVLAIATLLGALASGCGNTEVPEVAGAKKETAETAEAPETTAEAPTEASEQAQDSQSDDKVIRVGATAVPHAEILDNVLKDVLAEEGWELETVVFSDYVLPNTSLEAEELDANYFQTLAYLNSQNEDAGLHLVAVAGVHIEPMGIYSQKYTSLEELPDGAAIGVPNGPENEDRGIDLLVQKGLLVSNGGFGTDPNYTEDSLNNDKEANPHGYVITPLDAAQLALSLPDLDAAAINGNYALEAGLPATYPALGIEEFNEETSIKRTNFLVVKEGNEETEKTQALIKALQSDKVQSYIEDTYKGAVITSYIDPQ